MKKGKIAFIIASIAAIAIAGVVVYVLTNINSIVEAAIERYGSQAAGTPVRVSSVDIRLSNAQGTINGLTVANPPGFSSSHVFKLGTISTRIAARSITKTPVVVDDITISGPEIYYEMNESGVSNLDQLKKNIQRTEETEKKEPDRKRAKKKETRLYIRRLVFEKGRIDVRIAARGNRQMTVNLPRIELAEIGRNGGATPAQVAQTVLKALAEETAKAVAKSQGEQYLRKGAEGLLKRYLK